MFNSKFDIGVLLDVKFEKSSIYTHICYVAFLCLYVNLYGTFVSLCPSMVAISNPSLDMLIVFHIT